ncbi:MAG: hypothetical protein NC302_09345 [Bacteroidales bacterium]|nr:hypothetical protein [Bacteroidales bacterium]MCM1416241.1 hypothetical protein [bacterium]MCM1424864.1 hypothetical protein [bacterium]
MKQDDFENRNENKENGEDSGSFLQSAGATKILLGIIAVLLVCILILLGAIFLRGKTEEAADRDLQQTITDYAKMQQEADQQIITEDDISGGEKESVQTTLAVPKENLPEETEEESVPEKEELKATVVDIEDESDEAYTKEFILKEAYPHFEANNQDAIWDLAHLKRYVKLSRGLLGTGEYYYQGDVDSSGKPHGTGLAIYERNSYYFGEWSHGKRSGKGSWFRFYIGQKNKANAMGVYASHSYSGEWADDLPNGEGAEHYEVDVSKIKQGDQQVIQNVVGNFTAGLYDGELFANTVNYTGTIQEWDGIAEKGVFKLWRDMSSIGECSVWRNKDDHTWCLDIDKSENKEQGIRELFQS